MPLQSRHEEPFSRLNNRSYSSMDNGDFVSEDTVVGIFSRQKTKSNRFFIDETVASLRLMLDSKLNILLVFGPLAALGSITDAFGEFFTFLFAGLALIPCAERLSFVTEQVSFHTNETIGALLNATFGNAPEFLISSAALRSGFYRVVQLTLLGSMLTNLLFVFGLSCFVGGLHWQTQLLRATSGNVSIGILLLSAVGIMLPAVLKLADESMESSFVDGGKVPDAQFSVTKIDVAFSRLNSCVMVLIYMAYLIFQLGSHKEEFDFDDDCSDGVGGYNVVPKARLSQRRNRFFTKCCFVRMCPKVTSYQTESYEPLCRNSCTKEDLLEDMEICTESHDSSHLNDPIKRLVSKRLPQSLLEEAISDIQVSESRSKDAKSKNSDNDDIDMQSNIFCKDKIMSMRMGLFWLGVITAAISVLSDIIVETIDGFAARSKMSEVFTSVVIIPYFSNIGKCSESHLKKYSFLISKYLSKLIAEQVSAVIFAYRNKMDLCIGVTIGSAIQIAQLVMPGCVLVGWIMDRPMTLYFRAYESTCLLLAVLSVAVVLQGGTTNWLVGAFFIGLYVMVAAGFGFHMEEDLSPI